MCPKIHYTNWELENMMRLPTPELKKINNLGTTILMVTHDREIVNSQKMRVVTLDEGTIVNDQRIGRYIL